MMVSDWAHLADDLRHECQNGRIVACFRNRPRAVRQMLEDAERNRPDSEALVADGLRLTWRQLGGVVDALSSNLEQSGLRPGDRVVLLLGNCAAFVFLYLAGMKLGAIIVPVSPREQQAGVEYIVRDCAATAIFYNKELEAAAPGADLRTGLRFCLDVEGPEFAGLLQPNGIVPERHLDEGKDEVAVILYTSGTTGRPKGAMLTHGNIVHSSLNYVRTMDLGSTDRTMIAVPMGHVTGLVALIAAAICAQGAMIVMRTFSARDFLRLAEAERMTHTVMVPAMYNLCLLQDDVAQRDLSAWRVAGYGGSPMTQTTIERLAKLAPGLKLMNLYGATETTSPAVIMPPTCALNHRAAVGLPAPGATILVMDEDGREVARGQIGEIWIGGAMVAKGYWGNPAATASEFVGGYWRSGDLGMMDEDGFVHIQDRKKDMINRGGFKIYSAEVESLLAAQEGVIEAAVVGRPCPVLGERVHAVVTFAPGSRLPSGDELKGRLARELADYKVPETWVISDVPLPRNPNGKVMKRVLRETLEPYRPTQSA